MGRSSETIGRWPGAVAALLLVVLLAGCRNEAPSRPQPGVDVQHYDVHLRIDRDDPGLRGRATLTVHFDDTVDALRLGFSGLRLDSLRVDGVAVDGRRRGSILSIPGPWPPKPYRVEIQYTGEPSTGYYRKEVGDDPVRFTDSWPTRGRGWLPGVHHPSDPATLRLTLDAPIGPDVVATGALIRRDTLQTGHVRTSWSLDVPAPTYAFGFAMADFDAAAETTATGLPLGVYSLPGAASMAPALPTVARAADALTELLGPYPYANYRAAHVPIAYAGMENASLAFIDPTLSSSAQTTVLVHELAHQWFGNHVVLDDWHDLWLSEGMATFLAIYAMERQDSLAARARWIELARLSPQRRRSMVPLVRPPEAEPDAHLTWVVYEKGASVLYLLRQTVGDSVFAEVLRETIRRHADRPLSTEAFQAVAEAVSGLDLERWFEVWVYRTEVPRLRAEWQASSRTLRWFVEGDGGTLDGVPVPLRIQQDGHGYDASVVDGQIVLPGEEMPEIDPVGVMLDVQVRAAED